MSDLLALLGTAPAAGLAGSAPASGSTAPVDAQAFAGALQQALAGAAPGTVSRSEGAAAGADGEPAASPSAMIPQPVAYLPNGMPEAATAQPATPATPAPATPAPATPAPATPAPATPAPARADGTARASDAPPTSRSLDRLVPEFRAKLERVIGRAERELGYEVRILETYRAPERQQALFEQGRTTTGPVVTWTRSSLHTEGRATDLLLVGASPDSTAYARLGEIAAQEGLRTLGPRDPGHVELPRTGTPDPVAPRPTPAPEAVSAVQRIMAIAHAAGRAVPRAEDVATFAREIARDALSGARAAAAVPPAPALSTQPAQRTPATREIPAPLAASGPAAPAPANPPVAHPFAPPAAVEAAAKQTVVPEEQSAASAPADAASSPAAVPATQESSLPQPAAPTTPPRTAQPASPALAARDDVAADVAGRIDRVVALQEELAARPVHSVLLRLDEQDSPLAHIRVGLRGSEVSAALDVTDARLAGVLRADLPELQRALERHGLDALGSETLRVLSGAVVEPVSSASRSAAPGGRDASESPYRQPQGGQRDPQQQRSRGQQRQGKEQP